MVCIAKIGFEKKEDALKVARKHKRKGYTTKVSKAKNGRWRVYVNKNG